MCLLALAVPLKPLAHIVANYARYERHKEIDQDFQQVHPLSVASLGKGSGDILTKFDQKCKDGKVKLTPFLPNLLRPMVEPFYQPGNGLSRWNSSTYGLALPRLQGYYNLHAGGCLVDILSTNRKKNVPNLDTFVRRILTTTGQEAIIKGKKDGLPGCCREVGQLVKFLA